ncbi:MAG: V-type ATP synthase subunit E [Parasporobacterium sp.]|nr:V-type ATP synthase subunit E [Parasporobacterium sp.]
MSGLDKIIEHINNEASENAKKILANGKSEADRILTKEKEEADRLEKQIGKQSQLDVANASKRIQSAADLKEKRLVLEAKQKEIDSVIDAALEKLRNLSDPEYFAYLEKMMDKYSTGAEGVICLSEKDLGRLPKDFEAKAKTHGLTMSKAPVKIDGGFVLVYGDVEENCSFEALVSASRESLQDKIGQILFN